MEGVCEFIKEFTPDKVASICGVEADLIQQASRLYATAKPSICFHGTFFKVDYENTYKRSQHSAVKMAPKIEVEPSTKIELGEVSLDKDEERTYVAKFSGSERMLSDVNLGNRIEWELAIPPGQVLRQYLMGNLYLYVESVWDKDTTQGRVILRPSDISFFDSQRRLISGVKTCKRPLKHGH